MCYFCDTQISYGWIGRDTTAPSDGHLQHSDSQSTPDGDEKTPNNNLDYCNSTTDRHEPELEHGDTAQSVTDKEQCRQSDIDNDVFIEYVTKL